MILDYTDFKQVLVFEKCLSPGQNSWVYSKDYLHQIHVGKQTVVLNIALVRPTFRASLNQTAGLYLGVLTQVIWVWWRRATSSTKLPAVLI